jgi:hypothetical protein
MRKSEREQQPTETGPDRPAVVDIAHEFQTGKSTATFENDVVLTVRYIDPSEPHGIVFELQHPDGETHTWEQSSLERAPGEVLVEILGDFYHEVEDRDVKVPNLDWFMQQVERDRDQSDTEAESDQEEVEDLLVDLDEQDNDSLIEAELDDLDETVKTDAEDLLAEDEG